MSSSTRRIQSGFEFEERIAGIFKELGFRVERQSPTLSPGFDMILAREDFPFVFRTGVEIKYYERSLVPIRVVSEALELAKRTGVNKAAIVTSLGFSEEALDFASKQGGRISLLTEAEILVEIPGNRRRSFVKDVASADYFRSTMSFVSQSSVVSKYLGELSEKELAKLLTESLPKNEIVSMVIEKVPPEALIEGILQVLSPGQLTELLRQARQTGTTLEQKKPIEEKYRKALAISDSNLKGKLLEEVVKEIIELVPGLSVLDGARIDTGIEEIDLEVRNHNREYVWADFEGMIFVECKNWSKAVGSDEIDHFKATMGRHQIHAGILVAVNGTTGSGLDAASGAIKMYLQEGFKIIIVDGEDLEDIFKCVDVSDKIEEKYRKLYRIQT